MNVRAVPLVLLLCLLAGAAPAWAADPEVVIRGAELEPDGETELTVSVTGDGFVGSVLSAENFVVREAGERIDGLEVRALLESGSAPVTVLLVMDVSGSTRGEPIDSARAAAIAFASELVERGAEVGLVAFGAEARLQVAPTTEFAALDGAISQLEASGETALYDGVRLGAEVVAGREGIRQLVVFSDGGDTVSASTLDEAIAASAEADVAVTTVALETPDLEPAALRALAASTGGTAVAVAEAAGLASAFEGVARDIASQYILTYRSEITEPVELPIEVSAQLGDARAAGSTIALNSREIIAVAPPELPASRIPTPTVPAFTAGLGFTLGLGAAFVAALLLLLSLLWRPGQGPAARTLARGLRIYSRDPDGVREVRTALPTAKLTERAVQVMGKLPKPSGFEDGLQNKLDRAAWPLRANEFLVLNVASGILGGLVAFGLTESWLAGLFGLVVGAYVPVVLLGQRTRTREKAFMEQLPGTLQMIAGSLQAGYGVMQAIDTVVQESEEPTSSEFARALTESRLGMPLEDALDGMAERLGSEDFRWVVLAINIQRQVGGNLADLLAKIAETMRSREQVRRQVSVLTAEGRISAWVIGLMPFIVASALTILNPGYLRELFVRPEGQVMLVGAAMLLVAGIIWLRRLVRFEF